MSFSLPTLNSVVFSFLFFSSYNGTFRALALKLDDGTGQCSLRNTFSTCHSFWWATNDELSKQVIIIVLGIIMCVCSSVMEETSVSDLS